MPKKRKKRYTPPSVQARLQREQAARDDSARTRSWIWGGLLVVAVLAIMVTLWFTVGPGKPASAEPTPSFTPTPVPTLPPSPVLTEPTGQEEVPMPANPLERNNMYSAPPQMQIDSGRSYLATISTAKGNIVVQLDASAAPQTVNNFVFLTRAGFYDGLTFHRVVPDFVVQGGDPLGSGGGGPGYQVPAEIGLPHTEGAIAMARQADSVNPTRASSGSQFYIALTREQTAQLDGAYTVFGYVIEGMDVVQSIAIGDVIESIVIAEE